MMTENLILESKKTNILIIDDNPDILLIEKEFLKHEGYDVITADNRLKAIEEVKNNKINLVLLDISMPLISGIEILKEIKKIKQDISVVIVTAYYNVDILIECMKLGACDYILKPFDLQYLKNSILSRI